MNINVEKKIEEELLSGLDYPSKEVEDLILNISIPHIAQPNYGFFSLHPNIKKTYLKSLKEIFQKRMTKIFDNTNV